MMNLLFILIENIVLLFISEFYLSQVHFLLNSCLLPVYIRPISGLLQVHFQSALSSLTLYYISIIILKG